MHFTKFSSLSLLVLLCAASIPAVLAQHEDEGKTYPAQATVAAKKPFATVPAASPAVAKALNAAALDAAQKMIGKAGAFQGTVSKVYVPHGNSVVILDFAFNYHAALTAVVKPDAYAKFPDLSQLEGKHVLISGKFIIFHNAPQIELTSPAQVKVIL